MKSFQYEGYWYNEHHPELPKPEPQESPVELEFLDKLCTL